MFCPRCGAQEQQANAYCKRCGEWLPELKTRVRPEWGGGDNPRLNLRIMLILNALSVATAVAIGVMLYAGHAGRADTHWSVKLAAALCLTMAGWQLSSFLIALRLRNRLRRARRTDEAPGGVSSSAIEAAGETREPLPAGVRRDALGAQGPSHSFGERSVAEPTTKLLQPLGRRGEERDKGP